VGKRHGSLEVVEMNAQFWRSRRVFLTGHTGFKGSWLSLWLQQLGCDLTGYALDPNTEPSLFAGAHVARGMNSVVGDIRHEKQLTDAVMAAQPEIVIHMAAQPLVRQSYAEPVATYATNVMGTVHLLEAVRKTPSVKAVLVVTTDKCYDNQEWIWPYRENETLGGRDPYSNSKACAELIVSAYRHSYFEPENSSSPLAIATARAGNVIGGGDWAADRLIPDIVRALINKQQVQIRNPHAIRPWQHVLEPLAAYLSLAEKLFEQGLPFAQAWNIGPAQTDAQPVQWIVARMCKLWGQESSWVSMPGHHVHEAQYLKLDISKAQEKLHWQPRLNIDQALDWTVHWFKQQASGANQRDLCLEQITQFETCA
jgi:CDP-glucose 4,6-dehydratase